MTVHLFTRFASDADELLRGVSRRVDDLMLTEIAAADYRTDVEEHLIHLKGIRDRGMFELPIGWHPREVLELIRWSNPEDPSWKPGLPGERGHWMRAFACSALLRAAGEPDGFELREGWNQTLIQLVGSLRTVGQELYGPAVAFLAWLIPNVEEDRETEELAFFMICLLWFALQLPNAISDGLVIALSERIAFEVQKAEELHRLRRVQGLLGTTPYNSYHADWKRLGVTLMEMNLHDRSDAARDWVRLVGSELAGVES